VLIDIKQSKLINKAYVLWDYSVESNYWQSRCYSTNTLSVDSYGLHEEEYKDDSIWYTNSLNAINLAERYIIKGQYPPKSFKVDTDLYLLRQELGDTVRLVDSFYQLNDQSGFMITESEVDMDSGVVKVGLGSVVSRNVFILDVSFLDGDDMLL
jgi:hypothetical protein